MRSGTHGHCLRLSKHKLVHMDRNMAKCTLLNVKFPNATIGARVWEAPRKAGHQEMADYHNVCNRLNGSQLLQYNCQQHSEEKNAASFANVQQC